MVSEKVRTGENVYAVLTNHTVGCKVVEAGKEGLSLPESACDCGALWSQYGQSVFSCHNIVTDAGDIYYAELGAGETPTNAFDRLTVAENDVANSAPAKGNDSGDINGTIPSGATSAIDGTYPQTDDSDTNNPGTTTPDTITWRASFATGDANGATALTDVVIHVNGATFGSGTDPLLMHAEFSSSFTKTSADTLKVYCNHLFTGV